MDPKLLVTIILYGPLIGAVVAGLFGRRIGNVASQTVTTGFLMLSAVLSWVVFSQWTWGHLEPFTNVYAPFIHVGNFISNWSFRLDGLSAVMLVVVTTVSSLVHLYSWGYMAEDDSKPRFFAYLSLFTFAMLSLISAADFMQLFFGWEGVGLASYLLIGFWFHKPTANAAAIKAFVVNRVGDFGFALGIMTVFWSLGSIQFAQVFPLVAAHAGDTWQFAGQSFRLMDLACTMSFWVQPDDPPAFLALRAMPSTYAGAPSRREALDRYARRTGFELEPFNFYTAYGLFRRAIIEEQKYSRYLSGEAKDPRYGGLDQSVQIILEMSRRAIEDK